MKRLIGTAFLIFLLSIPSVASSETLKVIMKESAVRREGRFLSPVLLYVKYGDQLGVLERKGDWYRVGFKGKEGWIHKGAVEERRIDLGAILGGGGARQDEVALAGKGFNPEVERAYRDKHPEAGYRLVDRVEAIRVSETEVESFIREGGLGVR